MRDHASPRTFASSAGGRGVRVGLLCALTLAAAQPTRPSGFFIAVTLSADGLRGALIGDVVQGLPPYNQSLWTTVDGGGSWAYNSAVGSRAFSCLGASSDGATLIAGTGNGLFVSRNGGASWSAPQPNGTWGAAAASANGSVLVAGLISGAGGLNVSTDGGASWTQRAAQSWQSVAVSGDGTTIIGAVGYGVLVSYNGGANFSVPAGAAMSSASGVGVSASGRVLVAVGGYPNGTVAVSANGGGTWTVATLNLTDPTTGTPGHWGRYVAVSADGTRIAIAVTNSDVMARSTDAGETFAVLPTPTYFESVAMSADGAALIGVSGGGAFVYTSMDGGVTWATSGPVPTRTPTPSRTPVSTPSPTQTPARPDGAACFSPLDCISRVCTDGVCMPPPPTPPSVTPIKVGVAFGVLFALALAAAAAAAALRALPAAPAPKAAAGGAPAHRWCPAAPLPNAHAVVACFTAAFAALSLITPWTVQVTSVGSLRITVLAFLQHLTCTGDATLCSAVGTSVAIIDEEAACLGDATCLATFAYTHVATVFAVGGAAFATVAAWLTFARPPSGAVVGSVRGAAAALACAHVAAAAQLFIAWGTYGNHVFPEITSTPAGITFASGPGLIFAALASLLALACAAMAAALARGGCEQRRGGWAPAGDEGIAMTTRLAGPGGVFVWVPTGGSGGGGGSGGPGVSSGSGFAPTMSEGSSILRAAQAQAQQYAQLQLQVAQLQLQVLQQQQQQQMQQQQPWYPPQRPLPQTPQPQPQLPPLQQLPQAAPGNEWQQQQVQQYGRLASE